MFGEPDCHIGVLAGASEHGPVVLPDVPADIKAKAAKFIARHNEPRAERRGGVDD